MNMRLTFKYIVKKTTKTNENIIEDLWWHVSKMYNITLYDIQENNEIRQKLKNSNLNIASSSVYSDYRKNNWYSEYLHSHTLQQTIIHALHDYKTYIALDEMYTKEPNKLKGKPHMPRYTKAVKEVVVFTKYAIRRDKNIIKLSLSKKMQEKHKVKSLNFEIPKKVQKLICMESIKQIVIKKKNGNYEISIIYERQEKERRIKRGIFKTNENKLINADINGSLNILRKYLKNSIPNLEIAMDNGREQRPFKKNVV